MNRFETYTLQRDALCKNHKGRSLYVFRAVLADKFSEESSIGLAVYFADVQPKEYAGSYFDFKFLQQEMF